MLTVYLCRVMHATIYALVYNRYTEFGAEPWTGYEELGFHLACCLAGTLPKTSFDVFLWMLATVFLLSNFEFPHARFTPTVETCTCIRRFVQTVYRYYRRQRVTFGEHMIPSIVHAREFVRRAYPE